MRLIRQALWLAVAASIPALAQQTAAPTPAVQPLGKITVTGNAEPGLEEMTAIGASALASGRTRTSDTASLLDGIPGVSLYGAGGVSSLPAIHGLADDRVRMKVDGMDLIASCPNHMNPALSYIDPTDVGSLRVYVGITPVSLGGDSLGGTIAVSSPNPSYAAKGEQLIKGSAGSFYRSNGDGFSVNAAATVATDALNLSYAGSIAQSADYSAAREFKPGKTITNNQDRTGAWLGGDVVGSTRYRSENQSVGFATRWADQTAEFKWSAQYLPYEGFPNQRMDVTGNYSNQFNFRWTGRFDKTALTLRIYDQETDHAMDFGPDKQYWYGTAGNVAGMPMNTTGRTFGAVIGAEHPLSERDTLRAGLEYLRYRLNDWWSPVANSMMMSGTTFWNINNGQRDRYDAYAEWDARWNPSWQTLIGVRLDNVIMDTGNVQGYNTTSGNYAQDAAAFNAANHRKVDYNWDVTLLARYTPSDLATYEGGYARKARSPNLYERYTWSTTSMAAVMNNFVGDGNGYVGNLALDPEVANTFSITGDWHDADRSKWGLKGTAYYTYVQNYIDAIRCDIGVCVKSNPENLTATNKFVNLQYVNQSAQLYGIDLAGTLALARTENIGTFTASGTLSWLRGTNETSGGNLYNIMPLSGRLALVQQWDRWTNTAEVQAAGAKTQISAVRNEIQTAGYALFNLRSSYQQPHLRIDLAIENLFNTFYDLPLGGAYVGQGQTMSINGIPWGIAVPGRARTFYVGLALDL